MQIEGRVVSQTIHDTDLSDPINSRKTFEHNNIVDMGGFGHLMDFCNFWTRELHLNSSYGLGILRQPFRTMSCRKFGS